MKAPACDHLRDYDDKSVACRQGRRQMEDPIYILCSNLEMTSRSEVLMCDRKMVHLLLIFIFLISCPTPPKGAVGQIRIVLGFRGAFISLELADAFV